MTECRCRGKEFYMTFVRLNQKLNTKTTFKNKDWDSRIGKP